MKRYSYKAGIVFGLFLAAFGGLLFFPGCLVKRILGVSQYLFHYRDRYVFLETAPIPYVTVLGNPETAPRRVEPGTVVQRIRSLYLGHVPQ